MLTLWQRASARMVSLTLDERSLFPRLPSMAPVGKELLRRIELSAM
jgi:hypothetical protein